MTKVGLICLDTETTGLDYTTVAVPWEVGWIAAVHDFDTNVVTCLPSQQWQLHLTAEQHFNASPAALKVGRYNERYTHPGPEQNAAMKAALIADCVAVAQQTKQMPHMLGANPTFDFNMMLAGEHFTFSEWSKNFSYRLLDIQALAAGALKWWSVGLYRIAEKFSIEQAGAHEALDDAITTIRCYAACYDAAVEGLIMPERAPELPKPPVVLSEDW